MTNICIDSPKEFTVGQAYLESYAFTLTVMWAVKRRGQLKDAVIIRGIADKLYRSAFNELKAISGCE